jgi:xylulokinase
VIGEVTPKAAMDTGLAAGTPVIAGGVDCNAGYLGGGAINAGDIQMNLGTCGNFGIIHKSTDFLDTMIVFPYTVNSEDTYITVPTTTTGGGSIRYLRDNFSQVELAMEKLVPDMDVYDLLNMEAERIDLGSNGLVILPYLMGERSPIWDVNARCVIFGLSLSHTKPHIVRAMMEGVAYALYHNFEIIKDAGWGINYPIVLNEGGAKSKLWRRIITDVFNVPTVFVKERAGAPYGDAIHAGVVTGLFGDYAVARDKAEYIEPMEPIAENHERYMEYFRIYKNLYEHLRSDFRDLAEIRAR